MISMIITCHFVHNSSLLYCALFVIAVDANECTSGDDDCDSNAACTNTIGSFTCACNSGYTGDGQSCTGE